MDGQEFSSDDREANRDYADNVKVSVRIGDMPVDEYVTEALEVVAPGAAWSRKWLVDQVEDLPAEAVKPGDPPSPYAIDVIERRHEWGASAATFEILLYLASAMSGGIVGNAAYDAVKVVVKKMTQRLAASGDHGLVEPITEAEARERAEALINSRFREPVESLQLRDIEIRPPFDAVVTYRGINGWDYTCEMTTEEGLVHFSRVRRIKVDTE